MPIFEYRCSSCHKLFEDLVLAGMTPGPVRCPSCNSDKAEKIFSSFAARAGEGDDFGGDDFSKDTGEEGGGESSSGEDASGACAPEGCGRC